jgi:hypothetical protein
VEKLREKQSQIPIRSVEPTSDMAALGRAYRDYAMDNLGRTYWLGRGGLPVDRVQAIKLYRAAIYHENPWGRLHLAEALEKGEAQSVTPRKRSSFTASLPHKTAKLKPDAWLARRLPGSTPPCLLQPNRLFSVNVRSGSWPDSVSQHFTAIEGEAAVLLRPLTANFRDCDMPCSRTGPTLPPCQRPTIGGHSLIYSLRVYAPEAEGHQRPPPNEPFTPGPARSSAAFRG